MRWTAGDYESRVYPGPGARVEKILAVSAVNQHAGQMRQQNIGSIPDASAIMTGEYLPYQTC